LPARASWELATPYDAELTWPAVARACLDVPLHAPPGARDEYTNVGYALLGVVVERVTGRSFAAEVAARVLAPLGAEAYLGTEPPRRPARVEYSGPHAGTPVEPNNSALFRALALPGAGLVTTAAGALALVRAFRGVPTGLLRPETRAEATRDQTGDRTGVRRGLGPALSSDFAPAEAGPGAFGHAGGSGCLAWAAPSAGVAWAICTTRCRAAECGPGDPSADRRCFWHARIAHADPRARPGGAAAASDLVAENLLLRHQLAVLTRPTRKRPHLCARDKLLWVLARRCCTAWRRHLVLVQPETVVR
jgi:CubicO group peptidase (beta-lactamase class C family)